MRIVLAVAAMVLAGCADPQAGCTVDLALASGLVPPHAQCSVLEDGRIGCGWQTDARCVEGIAMSASQATCVPEEHTSGCLF